MEYSIKGKISLEDYKAFNRAALIHKKSYLIIILVALLSIFSSIISSIKRNPGMENIIAQFVPILILFFVYFLIFKIYARYSFKSDRTLQDEITLTLTEKGVQYASCRGSYAYTLEDFRKIIITKTIIAIYVSYRKAILIPRHFFTSKEQEAEIEAFIKENYAHANR